MSFEELFDASYERVLQPRPASLTSLKPSTAGS